MTVKIIKNLFSGTDDRFKHGWIGFGSFDRSGAVNNIHVWADPDTVQEKTLDPFHD